MEFRRTAKLLFKWVIFPLGLGALGFYVLGPYWGKVTPPEKVASVTNSVVHELEEANKSEGPKVNVTQESGAKGEQKRDEPRRYGSQGN